jgi:hypothetical protein
MASVLKTARRALSRYVVSGYPGRDEVGNGLGEMGVIGEADESEEGGLKTRSVMARRTEMYACWFRFKDRYSMDVDPCGIE